ncbi:hypothetical protein ACFLW0_07710, partial [Chloroflexota bacterium]
LVALGFYWLLGRFNRKVAYVLLGLLMVVSFVNALYLNDYHQETIWGITTLTESVDGLESDGKIAVDFDSAANYLGAVTDKEIISAFVYAGTYPNTRPTYEAITDEWLRGNDVTYLVLSTYGELHRTQCESAIHPRFLMFIEIPFIEVGEYGQLPPADCKFKSDFYNRCERDYQRVDTIKKGDQTVFIVYRVR